MGKLIDADNLEKELLELCGDNPPMFHYFSEAIKVIREQPTPYDVDKVISELKSHNNAEKVATAKLYNGEHRYYRAVSVTKAIRIVKGAVKDE